METKTKNRRDVAAALVLTQAILDDTTAGAGAQTAASQIKAALTDIAARTGRPDRSRRTKKLAKNPLDTRAPMPYNTCVPGQSGPARDRS